MCIYEKKKRNIEIRIKENKHIQQSVSVRRLQISGSNNKITLKTALELLGRAKINYLTEGERGGGQGLDGFYRARPCPL